jgi:hypothetical protein
LPVIPIRTIQQQHSCTGVFFFLSFFFKQSFQKESLREKAIEHEKTTTYYI